MMPSGKKSAVQFDHIFFQRYFLTVKHNLGSCASSNVCVSEAFRIPFNDMSIHQLFTECLLRNSHYSRYWAHMEMGVGQVTRSRLCHHENKTYNREDNDHICIGGKTLIFI